MSQRAGRACRSVWERRGLRWLAALAAVVVGVVVVGLVGVSRVSAGPPPPCTPGPINVAPAIVSSAGTGRVGTTLSLQTAGQWRPFCTPGATIAGYQWYRGLTPISGATGTSYTTTSADAGSVIRLDETACDTSGLNCDSALATGAFLVTSAPLGASSYYPMWSHGPVAVNEATGNVVLSLPTPSYPTATGSLGFSLTYNSQSSAAGTYGLGTGWTLSTGALSPPTQVHDDQNGSAAATAEVDWPDGSPVLYQEVGDGNTFLPTVPDGSVLTRQSSGSSWTWTLVSGGSTYTFGVENTSTGVATLNGVAPGGTANANGQVYYTFNGSGYVSTASYEEAPGDSHKETLTFNWSCSGYVLCVTGPDGVTWSYTGNASNEITGVNDGTRQLVALTYTSGQVTKIQNADDLDPTHASPGYNGSHALTLTYDSSSPRKLTCLIDGPISGQAATAQPSCAGGGTASESTWSFNYSPTCPSLKTPAVSHTVSQGTKVGCTTVTDPDQQTGGPGITVLYDTYGRPLEYDDARLGSGHERISLVEYNAQDQVAWTEDPDGNPTDYTYDANTGVLLSVTGPSPASGAPRPVTNYRYDELTIGTASTPGTSLKGLAGSYWNNVTNQTGTPTARENDPAPGSGITGFSFSSWPTAVSSNTSGFSARWSGALIAPETGDYTFTTTQGTADSTDFSIDGITALSGGSSQTVYLTANSVNQVVLDYAHNAAGTSGANVTLKWACSACSPAISTQTVPVSDLRPEWENQTSSVSPAGRISFQHFLNQASGQPDYSLVKVGSSNLITSHVYDSLGRETKQYMPKANASATINSTTGNLTSTPDTNYETDYTYYGDGATAAPPAACGGGSAVNEYGQLESTSIPNAGLATDTTVYNAAGLPVANTDGKGTGCLAYDAENRLTSQTPNGDQSHPISYTYDPNGTQLTASNQNGTVTTYYDEAGRLSDTTDASGAVEYFTYDEDGNALDRIANTVALSGTTCPSSTDYCTTYSYDAADELSGETDAAGHSWSFFYDTRGNLRGTEYPNGTFSWTDIGPAGDILDVLNRHGTISSTTTTAPSDSNPLADYTYTYVDGSNVYQDGKKLSQLAKSGSATQTTDYTYDAVGRLSQVLLPSGTCRDYNYDLDSNRTQTQESTTGCSGTFTTTASYTYDPSTTPGTDELTSIAAGATMNFGYTSDGQVSSQGTTSYTWNGLNQFATATVGSNTVTYSYDPTGALMTRATNSPSTTTNYALGDLFETNGSGTITASYTDGPAGDLASYNGPPTSSSTADYLYYDAHGNTAAEANSSGTLTANHTYDPFGAATDGVPSNATVHRFTGRWDKQYDTLDSLVLMGARPYDPNTGRFLSVDPVSGGSLNNYDYGDQDPINNYDLNGMDGEGEREGGFGGSSMVGGGAGGCGKAPDAWCLAPAWVIDALNTQGADPWLANGAGAAGKGHLSYDGHGWVWGWTTDTHRNWSNSPTGDEFYLRLQQDAHGHRFVRVIYYGVMVGNHIPVGDWEHWKNWHSRN